MSKREKKRKKARGPSGGEAEAAGGVMSSLRGGFKSAAGAGPKRPRTKAQQALDVAIWVLIAAAIAAFFLQRYR